MPLTHVCEWDPKTGYRRITVEEASAKFSSYTVPVEKSFFVCELCAQKIGLTKARKDTGTRYFYHSRGEQDKTCEDRQQTYDRPIAALNEHVMPIRIKVSGDTFSLQLGFFSPYKDSKQDLTCRKIKIATDFHRTYEYSFDRINSIGITYLDVGNRPSRVYGIEYVQPSIGLKKFWPTKVPGIDPSSGALFDKESGKLLPVGSKAYVGKPYYLMQRGRLCFHRDIDAKEIAHFQVGAFEWWYLYEISSQCFSERSAQFFLQRSIFLSEIPLEFYPIWPVYVTDPYFIYHEHAEMFFYLAGTYADLNSYPVTSEFLVPKSEPTQNGKLVKLFAPNKEQLLSLGTSGALGFSYLLKQALNMNCTAPSITVADYNGNVLEQDRYTKIPKAKGITISASFDGKVLLFQKGKIQEVLPLAGGEIATIDPISLDMEIRIYQGCDCVRTLAFQRENLSRDGENSDKDLVAKLSGCREDLISISHSFGAIAEKLKNYPKTKQWIYKVIRQGTLPRTAYNLLVRHIKTMDRRN